jgi:muconolactone D-isomerase
VVWQFNEEKVAIMLFLLKVEIKQMPQMPAKDFLGYVIKEWEYFSRFQRRGKILAGGKLAGRRGAAAVIDAESNEEMEEIVAKLPLFPFFTDIEITPLIPMEKAILDTKRIHALMK